MAVLNCFTEMLPEISLWRRDIHAHPESRFQEHRTSAFITSKLKEFGCNEVINGLGKTGVIGVVHGKSDSFRQDHRF